MAFRIVGLSGPIGTGKSTLASLLATDLNWLGLRATRYSLATPIKTLMNALFTWDDRHSFGELKEVTDPYWGFSPRYVYRMFGTEFARKMLRDDLWLRIAEQRAKLEDVLIVDDIRFPNESKWVRDNGLLVHVIRMNYDAPTSDHESDRPLLIQHVDEMAIAADLDELKAESKRLAKLIHAGVVDAVAV